MYTNDVCNIVTVKYTKLLDSNNNQSNKQPVHTITYNIYFKYSCFYLRNLIKFRKVNLIRKTICVTILYVGRTLKRGVGMNSLEFCALQSKPNCMIVKLHDFIYFLL